MLSLEDYLDDLRYEGWLLRSLCQWRVGRWQAMLFNPYLPQRGRGGGADPFRGFGIGRTAVEAVEACMLGPPGICGDTRKLATVETAPGDAETSLSESISGAVQVRRELTAQLYRLRRALLPSDRSDFTAALEEAAVGQWLLWNLSQDSDGIYRARFGREVKMAVVHVELPDGFTMIGEGRSPAAAMRAALRGPTCKTVYDAAPIGISSVPMAVMSAAISARRHMTANLKEFRNVADHG